MKKIQTYEGISYAQAVKKQKIDQNGAKDQTTNKELTSENKDQQQNNTNGNAQTSSPGTHKHDQDHDQANKPDYNHIGTQTENEKNYTPSSESTLDNTENELVDPMHTLIYEFVQNIDRVLRERGTKQALMAGLYEIVENLVTNTKLKNSEQILKKLNKSQKTNPNHE